MPRESYLGHRVEAHLHRSTQQTVRELVPLVGDEATAELEQFRIGRNAA